MQGYPAFIPQIQRERITHPDDWVVLNVLQTGSRFFIPINQRISVLFADVERNVEHPMVTGFIVSRLIRAYVSGQHWTWDHASSLPVPPSTVLVQPHINGHFGQSQDRALRYHLVLNGRLFMPERTKCQRLTRPAPRTRSLRP